MRQTAAGARSRFRRHASSPIARRVASLLLVSLSGCGGPTIANLELPLGVTLAIGLVIIVSILFVIYIGTRGRDD